MQHSQQQEATSSCRVTSLTRIVTSHITVHTDTATLIQPQRNGAKTETNEKRRVSYKLLDKNKVIYLHR